MERAPNPDGIIDDQERIVPLIVGIGLAGISAINALIRSGMPYADFVALDADLQGLEKSLAVNKIHISPECNAGAIGWMACTEAIFAQGARQGFCNLRWLILITDLTDNTNASHMAVISQIARGHGWYIFGIVTVPVHQKAVSATYTGTLRNGMDALLVFPHDQPGEMLVTRVDEILLQAARGIAEPFAYMNLISVDLAELVAMFNKSSTVTIGVGEASGIGRALQAAKQALAYVEHTLFFRTSVFINITGWNLSMAEISKALQPVVLSFSHEGDNIFIDCHLESMEKTLRVTIITINDTEV